MPSAGLIGAGAGEINALAAVELAETGEIPSSTTIAGAQAVSSHVFSREVSAKRLSALTRATKVRRLHSKARESDSTLRDDTIVWGVDGSTIVWGIESNTIVWGVESNTIVWGIEGSTIVWGIDASTIVWGIDASTIVWGIDANTIVWGVDSSTIVWGIDSSTIVWGVDGQTIVWG